MAGTLNDEIQRVCVKPASGTQPGAIDRQLWGYWDYVANSPVGPTVPGSQADRFRFLMLERIGVSLPAATKNSMSNADLLMYWQKTKVGTVGNSINELMRNWWIPK